MERFGNIDCRTNRHDIIMSQKIVLRKLRRFGGRTTSMGATNYQNVRIMFGAIVYRIWYILIGELEAQISCRLRKLRQAGPGDLLSHLVQNRMARGLIQENAENTG